MQQVAPLGPVYQAGTLSGNPLATAAGLAALDLLDAAAYATLTATAERLAAGLRGAFDAAGHRRGRAAGRQPRRPLLLRRRAGRLRERAAHRHGALRARSSTPCSTAASPWRPGAYEVLFPGLAHTDDVVDEVIAARRRLPRRRSRGRRVSS